MHYQAVDLHLHILDHFKTSMATKTKLMVVGRMHCSSILLGFFLLMPLIGCLLSHHLRYLLGAFLISLPASNAELNLCLLKDLAKSTLKLIVCWSCL